MAKSSRADEAVFCCVGVKLTLCALHEKKIKERLFFMRNKFLSILRAYQRIEQKKSKLTNVVQGVVMNHEVLLEA